jgi:hypothetical protein
VAGSVALALVSLALVAAIVVRREASQTFCQKVAVPAYIDPTIGKAAEEEFDELASHAPTVAFIVLDPDNGPGTAPNKPYRVAIQRARRAGIAVYGYVDSAYAKRPVAEGLTDIEHWAEWYDVRNIFFDQVTSSERSLGYYLPLAGHVHDQGGKVVFNPGIYPAEKYAHLADSTVTFEGSYADYRKQEQANWAKDLPPERFWHLVYGTPEQDHKDASALTRDRRAGYAYITDATLPNPWNRLPPYWRSEIRAVVGSNKKCAG